MFDNFTERAIKVLGLARQEAHKLNHEYIGTEHILLGLILEGSGNAAAVLKNMEIDLRKIYLEIDKLVQQGPHMVTAPGRLPFTPRAKRVIDLAKFEAAALFHDHVDTEHMLLGILRENEGLGAHILLSLNVNIDIAREEIRILRLEQETGHRAQRDRAALDSLRKNAAKKKEEESPYQWLHMPSFQLGVIECFCEMVGVGVKSLALSSPLAPSLHAEIADKAERIAHSYGVKGHLEKELLVTDLFPASVTEGKWVILFYKEDTTLSAYQSLKARKNLLMSEKMLDDNARYQLAWDFAKLLSYPDVKVKEMLAKSKSA